MSAIINPYAIYVHCDAGMDYDSKNTGGVGIEIKFPETIEVDDVHKSLGRYQKANIERLELEAVYQGMTELLKCLKQSPNEIKKVNIVIITTDRYSLSDQEKTSVYKISQWRRNKWKNHEGRSIKNKDLLDKIDKTRKKVMFSVGCRLEIQYLRRKYNKVADKLAEAGKKQQLVNRSIAKHGQKIGKRKYKGEEVQYSRLDEKEEYHIHVYKKEPVGDQWEVCTEVCEGPLVGRVLKIRTDSIMEDRLHRRHEYTIRLKRVFSHHVIIFRTLIKLK
ncbi:MAG: RNase H family protein [Patescibacteria group bacterium]